MSEPTGYEPRAIGTRRARPHSGLGPLVVGLGLTVAAAAAAGRLARGRIRGPARAPRRQQALGRSRDGAAILSLSVLADSALEHFRGGYARRPMYAAPTVGALSFAANMAEPRIGRGAGAVQATHAAAVATGVTGFYFHTRNVMRRPGGLCMNNLFYAAPLGAPGALMTAGLMGAVTHRMAMLDHPDRRASTRHGRELALLSAVALMGQTAEVGLLHFRGSFHDPFMYLPVTVPPLAAAGLVAEAARPHRGRRGALRGLLRAVQVLGVVGTGFHVFGVARNMGGWGNWRQNALQGPPTPAPISFIGLGQSGLAALDLLDAREEGQR